MTITHRHLSRLAADIELRRDTDTPPTVETLALWAAWCRAALASLET
jgi:hypothetical protein